MGVNLSDEATEQGYMGRAGGGATGRAARGRGRHRTQPLQAAPPTADAPEHDDTAAPDAALHNGPNERAVRSPRQAARAVRGYVIAVAVPGLMALGAVVSRKPPVE